MSRWPRRRHPPLLSIALAGGAHQRRRIYFGLAEAIRREGGWDGVTVAKIIDHARVSRRSFYTLFTDRGDCLRQAAQMAEKKEAPDG